MAKKYHPDLNTHNNTADYDIANQKFQEINHAYSVLSDQPTKNRYDDIMGNF